MAERAVLLGVVWRDGEPKIRIRYDDEPVSVLADAASLRLNYQLPQTVSRVCIGHVPFRSGRGDYHDCRRPPSEGKRTCEQCSIVEATFASNLHHAHTRGSAELDPSIRDHLQQPNRLYLAAFRDGSLKVGTSTLRRTDQRLSEQGAWIARLVAETTDGIAVRSLEDMATEVWALPQAINASRKLKGLVTPRPDDDLNASLDEAAMQIAQLMERAPDARVAALGDVGGERWRHPNADHPALRSPLRYPLKLAQGRHDLEVITALGRLLLVGRPAGDDVFVIDPAQLFGIQLDLGDYGSDEIAIQDSLF